MRVNLVKRETFRAHISVAFDEDDEVLTDERDERALVLGLIGKRVNLQFTQYLAELLVTR